MRVVLSFMLVLALAAPAAAQGATNARCGEFAKMLREKAADAEAFRQSSRRFALNMGAYDPAADFSGAELEALQAAIEVADPMSISAEEYANRLNVAATVMEACAAKP